MKVSTITPDQFIQGNYMDKLDFLSDVLEDFCSKNDLPLMSADDILQSPAWSDINLTQPQKNWLTNYIEVWDIIQENS